MSTNLVRPSKGLNTRRSQRLLLRIGVVIAGQRANATNFAEQTSTEVINAHGALVLLKEAVLAEQVLRIRNTKTGDEEPCRVVSIGHNSEGKKEIGVEFLRPTPRFWRVAFPPDDWNVHNPEAKRFAKKAPEVTREPVRPGPSEKG